MGHTVSARNLLRVGMSHQHTNLGDQAGARRLKEGGAAAGFVWRRAQSENRAVGSAGSSGEISSRFEASGCRHGRGWLDRPNERSAEDDRDVARRPASHPVFRRWHFRDRSAFGAERATRPMQVQDDRLIEYLPAGEYNHDAHYPFDRRQGIGHSQSAGKNLP